MNICFVSRHNFNPLTGGIERVTNILAHKLSQNHNVRFLCLVKDAIHEYNTGFETTYFPNEDIYSSININFLSDYIQKNNIDILVNQFGSSSESRLFLKCNIKKNQRFT